MCMLIASFVFFLFTKRDCKKVIYFVAFGMILGFCLLFKEQIKYASIKSPYGGIEVEIQRANTGAGRVEAIKKEIEFVRKEIKAQKNSTDLILSNLNTYKNKADTLENFRMEYVFRKIEPCYLPVFFETIWEIERFPRVKKVSILLTITKTTVC